MGPNYVLDKGFYVDPATVNQQAFVAAAISGVSQGSTNTLGDTVLTASTAQAGGAVNSPFIGVYQETLDAAKIATGKATVQVRILGISRAISNGAAALVPGDRVIIETAATGRFTKAAAVAGTPVVGIAMTPAAASAGAVFDLLLTPGAQI
jgi:hypothetical protein